MAKSVEYYISKGFSREGAEYFASGKRKIVSVKPQDNYTLLIVFDNGKRRLYDASLLIKKGTVFEFLSNLDNFKRVYIDENNCISWDIDPCLDSKKYWNNKVDLCPDSCYLDSTPLDGSKD